MPDADFKDGTAAAATAGGAAGRFGERHSTDSSGETN